MKKLIFATLTVLTLANCAEVTQKTYTNNGQNASGTVRYSTDWFMGSKNREKAVSQMKDYCAPNKPRLMAEDNQEHWSGFVSSSTSYSKNSSYTSGSAGKDHYTYLHFKCVRPKNLTASTH